MRKKYASLRFVCSAHHLMRLPAHGSGTSERPQAAKNEATKGNYWFMFQMSVCHFQVSPWRFQ
jgi:hypothetical protein